VAGGKGALQKPQLVSKESGWLVPRFIPYGHRARAVKRDWLRKEINHDSIPRTEADSFAKRWATIVMNPDAEFAGCGFIMMPVSDSGRIAPESAIH
jgi:hypothetical protein